MVDENLSPALARSLNALFAGDHEVSHLRERFGPSVTDMEWIDALSREGRWVILSGDRRITRSRAEAQAFRASKLVGFFMAPGMYKARVTRQMERLLALWDVMEQQTKLVQGGAMFELPMTSLRLRQL